MATSTIFKAGSHHTMPAEFQKTVSAGKTVLHNPTVQQVIECIQNASGNGTREILMVMGPASDYPGDRIIEQQAVLVAMADPYDVALRLVQMDLGNEERSRRNSLLVDAAYARAAAEMANELVGWIGKGVQYQDMIASWHAYLYTTIHSILGSIEGVREAARGSSKVSWRSACQAIAALEQGHHVNPDLQAAAISQVQLLSAACMEVVYTRTEAALLGAPQVSV